MLPKQPIQDHLNELNLLYNSPASPQHKDYYSKLALIELCGWIEICIDNITNNFANTKLKLAKNINHAQKHIIDCTYGFEYKKNLRPMLIKLIGIYYVEVLEELLDYNGDLTILVSQLNSLVVSRNKAAHTTIVGVTLTYDAPSVMLNYLNKIYPILLNLENTLSLI